jgi:ubiquinone/menaquinone biosynthesis C-methylase UbiE
MINNVEDFEHQDFLRHKKEFELFYSKVSKYIPFENSNIVDIGASWGMHIGFIVNSGVEYTVGIDIADYSNYFKDDYKFKVLQYYEKHGYKLTSNKFDLVRMDAQKTALKSSSFDIAVSINAFEHIPDPELALLEMIRILKPGGYAFISFIPVFFCDEGSHMINYVKEPWAHLMCNEEEYIEMLRDATPGTEYFVDEFKYGLNKLPRKFYLDLFNKYNNGKKYVNLIKNLFNKNYGKYSIVETEEWKGVGDEKYLSHDNFKKLKRRFSTEDLLFRGMNIVLRK